MRCWRQSKLASGDAGSLRQGARETYVPTFMSEQNFLPPLWLFAWRVTRS
jgi:hypothetical protein